MFLTFLSCVATFHPFSAPRRYQRLNQIVCRCKLLLTGTPIQNSSTELFSILHYLLPHTFTAERIQELNSASVNADRVRAMMAPFILRRLKSEVLGQLVAKADRSEVLKLGTAQRASYDGAPGDGRAHSGQA